MDKTVTIAKIIDTTYFSIGFPEENWDEIIIRDNYINQLVNVFDETPVIFIEGEEDSGKTTICAQFARRFVNSTITVFFNHFNLLDFKPEFYYSNVVSQIKHLLNEEIDVDENEGYVGIEKYQQYVFQLRKKLKNSKNKIFLILDGLEAVINENPEFIKSIFDIIPFGQDIFRIIISGTMTDYKAICPRLKEMDSKSITILGFSNPEVIKYLDLMDASDNQIQELYKITRGFPGRLKTLKRLLKNDNYSLENIDSNTNYKNWIEIDCETVNLESGITNAIISLVALNKNTFSSNEIAKILSKNNEEVNNTISEITVLEITNDNVNFVSISHKRYFSNILRVNKKQMDEMLIQYYASEESISSKIELTKLYAEKNNWQNVVELIDEKFIENILENTGILKKVNESLELGMTASNQMKSYSKIWKYSLVGSIVNEMDNNLFWESEIEARVSINDFHGAISLATSAVLKVDRFRLLALIARRQKEINNRVDEDLINLINDLYKITDLSTVGKKIYDIVSDLIYAIPNLAIEMIEKSSGNSSERNINDWVITKLSIAAIDSEIKENGNKDVGNTKKLEAIQNINYPSVKKINRAISFLVGNYTAVKVLDEVKKLSDSTEKLRLLRLWLNNNRSNIKDIENVIEVALDELILATSESTITLDVLKDLSFQLPYIKNGETKKRILKRIYSIDKAFSDLGLTKNIYIYRLNIFHAENTINAYKSTKIIDKIISDVEIIPDTLIKLESFSEIYSKLQILNSYDHNKRMKFVYSRILSLSIELFGSTANHFNISQNIIKTLSKNNPILGLKICEYINTQNRRDKARHLVLDSYLDNNLKYVKVEILKEIESSFEGTVSNDKIVINILERYAHAKGIHFNTIKSLLYFIGKVEKFENHSEKLIGSVLSYRIIIKNDEWKERLAGKYEQNIIGFWHKLEADWEKIDLGFMICSELAKINNSFANYIFKETESLKKESWIDSRLVAHTYINSIILIIRAYSGLIVSHNEKDDDYLTIENLINRIPSEPERLKLWTELAFNALIISRDDIAKKIYNEHIIPIIESIKEETKNLNEVLYAIVIVHIYNPNLALTYLQFVSIRFREFLISIICNYYLSKKSPFEVYDNQDLHKYNTSFSDLDNVVSLMSLMNYDVNIYDKIDDIYKSITNNKNSISKVQINTIVNKLKSIIHSKLPDNKNIKHNGYVIIAELKLALLNKEQVNWIEFIEKANVIPNESDSIFVKSILLESIPFDKIKDGINIKKDLIDNVIVSLESSKIHYEFVQRVIDLSEVMFKLERERWKKTVNKAFSISNKLDTGSEIYESQKRIIDSMHRLDPTFAKELIKTVDKENSENRINKLIHSHYEMLEISNKIKNNQNINDKDKENYRLVVSGIFKALKSLNSDRIVAKKISQLINYLPIGNKLPMHEVFPVFMYYLANCSRTYKEKVLEGSVSEIHRENFNEAVRSTNLVQLLSNRRKSQERSYSRFIIDEEFSSNKAIKPNSRDEALTFIRNWIQDEVEEFLFIVDPYFTKEGLEILKTVKGINEELEIDILGSKDGPQPNIEEEYKNYWDRISDELPPFTNITFCWNPENLNNFPIHDRWLLTKNGGMRMGTSINSLGKNKESELSIMKPSEALNILENTVLEYIKRKKREINNQRLSYKSFNL